MAIIKQVICDSCGKQETKARKMLTLHLYTRGGDSAMEGAGEPFKYDVHATHSCIAKLLRKIPRSFATLDALAQEGAGAPPGDMRANDGDA